MDTKNIQIQYVPVEDLKAYEKNPRIWSPEATEQLKQSVTKFGYLDPLVINTAEGRENVVLSGNFRMKVARELGIKMVPVIKVKIDDPEKEQELVLRMNRNVGAWSWEMLKDFEIETLMDVGFDDNDLMSIWDAQLSIEDDHFNPDEEIQKIIIPETKPGDLYQIGRHRLLCADSQNPENIKKIMGTEKADMFDTDFPFNIGLSYDNGIGTKGKYGGKTNDNKTDAEFKTFLKTIMQNGLQAMKPDCHFFSWADESYVWLIQEIYRELGIDNRRICLWIKNNSSPTPQVAFSKAFECCIYGTRKKPFLSSVHNLNEILNQEVGTGNRMIEDILDLLNIWMVKRLSANSYNHPTEKSPTVHEKKLKRCTKPGDIVLDLCAGSGSIMGACEQMGRKAYMCEIEPRFCDLIINRYKSYGKTDVKKLN